MVSFYLKVSSLEQKSFDPRPHVNKLREGGQNPSASFPPCSGANEGVVQPSQTANESSDRPRIEPQTPQSRPTFASWLRQIQTKSRFKRSNNRAQQPSLRPPSPRRRRSAAVPGPRGSALYNHGGQGASSGLRKRASALHKHGGQREAGQVTAKLKF